VDFETYLDILPNEFRTVLSRLRLIILILKFVVMAVTDLRDTNVYVYYVINVTLKMNITLF